MDKKEKDFIVELEVSGKILTRERAEDGEKAIAQAEDWDYINLPENTEESDVEVIPVDVEEISQYQLFKAKKEEIAEDMIKEVLEGEERGGDKMRIFRCPDCDSEIAIDGYTIYTIDCDCGREITKDEAEHLADKYIKEGEERK